MTCTELVVFPASEALMADRSTSDKALEIIGSAPGALGIYSGLAVEDQKTTYLAIGWETIGHHRALTKSAVYDNLKASFKDLLGGPLTVEHVHFDSSTTTAFGAPITEFATITLKEDKSKDVLVATLTKVAAAANKRSPKYAPSALGESVERPGTFFLVIGRDSAEAHVKTVESDATTISLLDQIQELSGVSIYHIPLTKFAKIGRGD